MRKNHKYILVKKHSIYSDLKISKCCEYYQRVADFKKSGLDCKKRKQPKYQWMESYDWLIDYLTKTFCRDSLEELEFIEWINRVGSRQASEVLITLFGADYISIDLQSQFGLLKESRR